MLRRILLVDASQAQRDALELAVDPGEWAVSVAADARAALDALHRESFDVALCDASIPGLDDFPLAPQLLRRQPDLTVLLASPLELAERWQLAARQGVLATVERPLRADEMAFALHAAARRADERRRAQVVESDLARAVGDKPIVGASEAMIELLEAMERTAGFRTPALLLGEIGTHREVIARTIHAQSVRRMAPFVATRCSGGAPIDVERKLFGSTTATSQPAPRAGSIGQAHGGTVFLDDVVVLSDAAQQRLIHLITCDELIAVGSDKPRSVDVRVICATTRPLDEAIEDGILRADLADLLRPAVLAVPALRHRSSDLPLLVDHLVARFHAELGAPATSVTESALQRLVHYDWPGNLRELENVIERAVLLSKTDRISLDELPASVLAGPADASAKPSGDFSLRRARRSFESDMIRRALRQTDGNRTRAAKLLEISHRALLYKIKEYGLRD